MFLENFCQRDRSIYIENLNLYCLLKLFISPKFFFIVSVRKNLHIYCFDISKRAQSLLNWLQKVQILHWQIQRIDYFFGDMRDLDGAFTAVRVWGTDLVNLCGKIRRHEFSNNALVQAMCKRFGNERILIYLEKKLALNLDLWLIRINAVLWHQRTHKITMNHKPVFITLYSEWASYLAGYAESLGVEVYWCGYVPRPLYWLKQYRLLKLVRLTVRMLPGRFRNGSDEIIEPANQRNSSCTIATVYTGRKPTFDLSEFSDFYWFPDSGVDPSDVLVYFNHKSYHLTKNEVHFFRKKGLRFVAMSSEMTDGPETPVWYPTKSRAVLQGQLSDWLKNQIVREFWKGNFRADWIISNLERFVSDYTFWHDFFSTNNVRIHISIWDWDLAKIAADQAISDLNGVSVSYQYGTQAYPRICLSNSADVFFGFSMYFKWLYVANRSLIQHFVSNGYFYDKSFPLTKSRSYFVRSKLQMHGARFIIAYFDEGTHNRPTSTIPNHVFSSNYEFLLRWLMEEHDLGLVFKPLRATKLYSALKPQVISLLDAAVNEGRCYIYSSQGESESYTLPNEAAQVSDLAIGHLRGATAALESFLAGVPTLLVDVENCFGNPVYDWGRGKVLFDNWQELRQVVSAYKQNPSTYPGLGDWSPTIDTLDPYRDGHACERMGIYVYWILEELKAGKSREEAMDTAKKLYSERWGADKISDQCSKSHSKMAYDNDGRLPFSKL